MGELIRKTPSRRNPFPDHEEWPLVFTHGDLSLSNVMLSDDGTLWIVDWADSGFYPPWMEALGVYRYENHPQSWKRLRWLIVGPTPLQQKNWEYFGKVCERYASMEPREATWPP
ncbi:hypothetical protein M413DRAFT_29676 [Hebeloma cylindrosporum]|uniref:Aminoglycoside phosphotransferase domain-containing protein n=1 Tax=Hebeloma cylindrosporum TaxID=76867 RepID=A0A0C2YDN9_HEBCY|nr:hypothetical protein M413DRAFT_29676 [Hebeloma cylindrosporum h7]